MIEMTAREFSGKVMGWEDGDYALTVHGKVVRWVRVSRTPFDGVMVVSPSLDAVAPAPGAVTGKATLETVPVPGLGRANARMAELLAKAALGEPAPAADNGDAEWTPPRPPEGFAKWPEFAQKKWFNNNWFDITRSPHLTDEEKDEARLERLREMGL